MVYKKKDKKLFMLQACCLQHLHKFPSPVPLFSPRFSAIGATPNWFPAVAKTLPVKFLSERSLSVGHFKQTTGK
jgi:hypothetical protein